MTMSANDSRKNPLQKQIECGSFAKEKGEERHKTILFNVSFENTFIITIILTKQK